MTEFSEEVGDYLDRHSDEVERLAREVEAATGAFRGNTPSADVAGYLLDHVVADPRDISALGETDISV